MRRLALAVLTVAVLAGCTPSPAPENTPPPLPDVVVEVQGTSDLESDPYVMAARASELGFALAANALDFSIAEFTGTRSPDRAEYDFGNWFGQFVTLGKKPIAYPGPAILLPLEVVENAAGDGATVTFCDASGPYLITANRAEGEYHLTDGTLTTWTLETEGGVLQVGDKVGSAQECDATGAPVGRFDPQPELPAEITVVIGPDGTER